MNLQEFGQSIKKKYPQYANVDDVELANKTIEKYPTYKSQVSDYVEPQTETPSSILSTGAEILKNRATNVGTQLKESAVSFAKGQQAQSPSMIIAGQGAGAINDIIGKVIDPVLKPVVAKIAETDLGRKAFEALNQGLSAYEDWKKSSSQNKILGNTLENYINIGGLYPGAKGGQVVKEGVVETATQATQKVKNVVHTVAEKAPQAAEKAANLLASEPGAQIKTILQETPRGIFDDYLKVAQEAALDPRKTSVFEKVSEKVVDATKQLESQKKSLGLQKSSLIEKAKVGLQPFTEAPRKAILEVMKLADNPLKNEIIQKLKSIKNKLGADKVIDEVQDMIYSAGRTNLIAEGSSIERQLRGILGRMNEELKRSLPEAYRTLNLKYAERIKIVETLNRALGEMVDGVPTRGAGLVKQFFSPAGTKTKELFDFILKNTGIDLAQETTVAKFLGELFDDPKIKSLLENIPTSQRGIIEKGVRFIAEKTGAGQKIRESIRSGSIEKGRSLTK